MQSILTTTLEENGILVLTLNCPEKLNVMNAATLQGLHQAVIEAKDNKAIKAILLTGTGKAFSAGADISQFPALNAVTGYEFAKRGQDIFRSLEQCGKPSLAAINGYAFGGGCELILSTSIRIAATNAMFAQPEVKLGLIPGYGGSQRLARLVGKGRAIDLCITGRAIKADEALTWGLITEVTEPEKLVDRAKEILSNIIALPAKAVSSALAVIDAGYDLSLEEALHLEALHFGLCCSTKDKQEGVNAFLEKRAAKFVGEDV
ncbi:enoyl-CoA hydratase-related protein [soil metagenome]